MNEMVIPIQKHEYFIMHGKEIEKFANHGE